MFSYLIAFVVVNVRLNGVISIAIIEIA